MDQNNITEVIASEVPNTPFDAGVRLYDMPRTENEPDLVPEVRSILSDSGVEEDALSQCYDKNRHIKAAVGRVSLVQRVQINRFLSLALQSSPENTTGLRSELLPQGPINEWLDLVKDKVAPFIVEKKLLV